MTPAYDFDVTGARAVVTGASRGIGAEVARALALAGAAGVTLIARDGDALEEVAEEVRRRGAEATVVVCDVTDGARLETAMGALGRIDVLVHAAGVNVPQSLMNLDLAVTDDLWATNVRAALHLTKLALPRMPAGAVVVLLSSQMGHVGAGRRSAYCATKHAVEGVTKALALELAPRGIRVVAIAPTFVETPMTRPFLADAGFRQGVLEQIPLGRLGTVEDVAAAVRFAASPAAAMITGSSIRVDGGWTAR